MYKTIFLSLVVLTFAVGCNNKKDTDAKAGLNEYAPPPAEPTHLASPTPTTQIPAVTVAPAREEPVAAGREPAFAAVSGKTYVVKAGDTLWGIAQRTYGNGNQWKKIAAANPSIKGNDIKVGQSLVLP